MHRCGDGSDSSNASLFIDRLPDSILSDIFVLAKSAEARIVDRRASPYTIASVSRRWRAIALSTTRLWDYVDVLRRPTNLVKTHILRSGRASLEIWLDIFYANMNPTLLRNIFHELGVEFWARSRSLKVMLDYERPALSTLTLDTINRAIDTIYATSFEEIVIVVIFDSWDPDKAVPDNSLSLYLPNSTILRRICLEQIDLSLERLSGTHTFPLLEQLKLSRINVDLSNLLFPLLSLLPNLAKLSLNSCDFVAEASEQQYEDSVTLQKLEKLTIRKCYGADRLGVIFRTLDLPGLQNLKLGIISTAFDILLPWVIDWLLIFRNNGVKKLILDDFDSLGLISMIDHIGQLENLEELYLMTYGIHDSSEVASHLMDNLLESSCCPSLREVQLPYSKYLDPFILHSIKDVKDERPDLNIYLGHEEVEFSDEDHTEDSGDGDTDTSQETESPDHTVCCGVDGCSSEEVSGESE